MAWAAIVFSATCSPAWSTAPSAPTPLMPSDNFSDSGYIKIQWDDDNNIPNATFRLEQSEDPDFQDPKVVYTGPDRASFISGLPNGHYYFRIRTEAGDEISEWSSTISVRVKHHSLTMALSLASLGLVVFMLTVAVVISGVKKFSKPK